MDSDSYHLGIFHQSPPVLINRRETEMATAMAELNKFLGWGMSDCTENILSFVIYFIQHQAYRQARLGWTSANRNHYFLFNYNLHIIIMGLR